jgi:GTP-binding protein
VHDFEVIAGELAAFSEKLAAKPVIVVATKLDATTDRTRLEKLRDFCAASSLEFHAISSATGKGIPELVRAMADALDRLTPPEPSPEDAPEPPVTADERDEHESGASPVAAPGTEES